MAITINGKTYRNLTEQVLKNKEDIAALQEGGGASDLEGQVSQLNQEMARTLKLPMSAPAKTKLVAVDSTNAQEMIDLAGTLQIKDGALQLEKITITPFESIRLEPGVYFGRTVPISSAGDLIFFLIPTYAYEGLSAWSQTINEGVTYLELVYQDDGTYTFNAMDYDGFMTHLELVRIL